jgi:hypothetical protein
MLKKLFIAAFILLNSTFIFSQVKFVCIGNSITHGSVGPGVYASTSIGDSLKEMSYRFWFWEKVDSAGINATMVGYQTTYFNQGAALTSKSRYTGHTFVNSHEGFYGILSIGFLGGGWNGCPDFDTRLGGYTPDVALIHIGTNDPYTTSVEIDATEANIRSIIQKLRNKNPNVTILLAKLSSFWSGINGRVDKIVSETSQVNSIVYGVDIANDFFQDDKTLKSMLLDGVHPNAKGQKLMARRWFDAYMKITKADAEKPSVPGVLWSTAMTASSIDLMWEASKDNTGVNVYNIYMNDSLVASTGNLSYKITGINTSTKTYHFRVSAVDFQKNESEKSYDIKAPSTVTFSVKNGSVPLSGATVTISTINQSTDGTGNTVFSNLRPGVFNYTVKATNYKNFAGNVTITKDTIINITLSSVGLLSEQDGVVLYPNPACDRITVANADGYVYEIIDVTGKVLLKGAIVSSVFPVDVNSLASGNYIIRIINGQFSEVKNIIISK